MKNYLYLIVIGFLLFSCQKEEELATGFLQEPAQNGEGQAAIPGHIRIKLKEGVTPPEVVMTRSGNVATGVEKLDSAHVQVGAYRMVRVFFGKYENLLKKSGLDRWYDVYFDQNVMTRAAVNNYAALPEVEKVDQVFEAQPVGAAPVAEYMLPVMQLADIVRTAASVVTRSDGQQVEAYPFNDPELPKQWHYHNDGTFLDGSIAGADINLFEAWKIETGSPNVLVAVMDGGIQVNHPDLQANVWTNAGETGGNKTDDDGNGYVDDLHGFNFVTAEKKTENGRVIYSNGALTDHQHGTHCAGTISAVNGNKIGVCGIAGGSGQKDGVRLMSCQIFHMDGDKEKGTTDPNMYIYAADNGAVISQNSWTSSMSENDFMNSALKEAIDYFITYAGCGADGQQLSTSPMKGGLVVFAAANDNTDIKCWPASYDKNLRVASMGPMFEKAVYSNYGSWVDLTAPGGEQNLGETYGILSTSVASGYAWLQGTSMACPHVSGCAALILSKYQGPGFTVQDLRDRIMNTVKNIDQYNPGYIGKMGKGYIDVGAALVPATTEVPATPQVKVIDSYDSWTIVEWTVGKAADGAINTYELYRDTKSFAGGVKPTAEPQKKVFDVRFKQEGDIMRDTIKGLQLGQVYYYSLRAIDRWGNISDYAPEVSQEVKVNNPPYLARKWEGAVVLDEATAQLLEYDFKEPENQGVTIQMSPVYSWVTAKVIDQKLVVTLAPGYGNAGNYTVDLSVADQYGKTTQSSFAFRVDPKTVAPVVVAPVGNMVISQLNKEQTINLKNVFNDPANGDMIFEVTNSDNNVAWVQRKDASLVINAKKNGITYVQVKAVNKYNLAASTSFSISVQSSSAATETWTTYPEAVSKDLTIILNARLQGNTRIRIYNAAGKQVLAKEVVIGENGYAVDMSSLARGVYVLMVEAQGEELTKNVVKI